MLSAHGLKPSPSRGGLGEWVSTPRPRTGSCRGRSTDLLLPQRFDRVQLRGLAPRVVAAAQAGSDRAHGRPPAHLTAPRPLQFAEPSPPPQPEQARLATTA